jgi:hypothetical protein
MLVKSTIPAEEVEKIPPNITMSLENISPKDNYTRKNLHGTSIILDDVKC